MTDSVEKVGSPTARNFLRAVHAVSRWRCGGPHRLRPSRPKTPAIDLRPSNQIEHLIANPPNFSRRSIFDFSTVSTHSRPLA